MPVSAAVATPGCRNIRIRSSVRSPLKIHKTGGAEKKIL